RPHAAERRSKRGRVQRHCVEIQSVKTADSRRSDRRRRRLPARQSGGDGADGPYRQRPAYGRFGPRHHVHDKRPRMIRPLLNDDHYYIVLDRYRRDVSIGIHDFGRAKPQPVTVSLAVAFPRRAEYSDRITEVIDYDFLRTKIAALVHNGHINLQET